MYHTPYSFLQLVLLSLAVHQTLILDCAHLSLVWINAPNNMRKQNHPYLHLIISKLRFRDIITPKITHRVRGRVGISILEKPGPEPV